MHNVRLELTQSHMFHPVGQSGALESRYSTLQESLA